MSPWPSKGGGLAPDSTIILSFVQRWFSTMKAPLPLTGIMCLGDPFRVTKESSL